MPIPPCKCNSSGGTCGGSHASVVLCDPTSGDRVLVVTTIPCVDGVAGDPLVEYFDPDSGGVVVPSGELVVCSSDVVVDFPTDVCEDEDAVRTTVCGVVTVDGVVSVDNFPAVQVVSGTVNVGNFPASFEVSNDVGNPLPISKDTSVNALGNPVWSRISDATTALVIESAGAAAGAALVRLAGNAQPVDLSAWTAGSNMLVVAGGKFTTGNVAGAAAIAANTRAWLTFMVDAAGTALGTSTNPVRVQAPVGSSIPINDNGGSITVDGVVASSDAKAEDSVAASGDNGIPVLGVRNDAAVAKTSADGDYSMIATDSAGRVGITDLGGSVTVDGSVSVSNFPASVEVSNDVGNPLPVSGTVDIGTIPEVEIKNDVGNPLPARLAGDAQIPDVALWTQFSDEFVMVGGLVSPVGTVGGAAAIQSGTRAWWVQLVNSAGVELGTAGTPIVVSQSDVDLTTSNTSSVGSSVATTTISSANSSRKHLSVYNDSALANMFLKLGSGASTSSFTVRLAPGALYEVPVGQHGSLYTGIVTAVWSVASGNARVTELQV